MKTNRPARKWIVAGICLAVLLLAAGIGGLAHGRRAERRQRQAVFLKHLYVAMACYAGDHDGWFPPGLPALEEGDYLAPNGPGSDLEYVYCGQDVRLLDIPVGRAGEPASQLLTVACRVPRGAVVAGLPQAAARVEGVLQRSGIAVMHSQPRWGDPQVIVLYADGTVGRRGKDELRYLALPPPELAGSRDHDDRGMKVPAYE